MVAGDRESLRHEADPLGAQKGIGDDIDDRDGVLAPQIHDQRMVLRVPLGRGLQGVPGQRVVRSELRVSLLYPTRTLP